MLITELRSKGDSGLLLQAIGTDVLEELQLEAAKQRLSKLYITHDCRFILTDLGNKEIDLQPVHKAVYLLFLAHPEGIEFKMLSEYADELTEYYKIITPQNQIEKIRNSVSHLINPLDNAINEKCSRIKNAFYKIMDEYMANYYIISSHTRKQVSDSTKIWYKRLKVINLPRELVKYEADFLPLKKQSV